MNYSIGTDFRVAVDDLLDDGDGLGLGHSPFAGDHFGEVAALAEFGNYVGVILRRIDIEDLDDVFGVFESFQDLDFGGEQVFMDLALEHLHVDHLDGDCFICGSENRIPETSLRPLYTWLE